MSDADERESPQTVHLAFGVVGKWPEDATKLLGVYEHEADAELIGETETEENDWYNWFTIEREVLSGPKKGEEQTL